MEEPSDSEVQLRELFNAAVTCAPSLVVIDEVCSTFLFCLHLLDFRLAYWDS